MRVAIELEEASKIFLVLEGNDDVPGIDSEAILDHICSEYMLGNRCVEKVLSECMDGLGAVTDNDYCEAAYNKVVSLLHRLIISVFQTLDEYKMDYVPYWVRGDLRLVHSWRNLYVFKLE